MKKLYGQSTLATLLTALIAGIIYRFSIYEPDHALQWRLPLDLKIYALAGTDVAQGGLLYDAPYIKDLPFTYPPFAGVLFQAFSGLSENVLISIWQFGSACALLAVVMLVMKNRQISLSPLTIVICLALTFSSLALAPIAGSFFFGQINIFLMLLVSLDLLPKKYRLPGIGIGLAAGLKLTPAYMGLVLLFQRRWWAVAGSLLAFASTVGIGFWLIPDAKVFWTESIFQSSRVGVHANGGAMAARSLLERLFGIEGGAIWILTIVIIVLINCAAAVVAHARRNGAAAMIFTGFTTCLISPFSWYHHFVWVVPFAVLVLVSSNQFLGARLPGVVGAQVAGALSFIAMSIAVLPWMAAPFWYSVSFYNLHKTETLQPWATLAFSGAALLYMLFYALSGLAKPSPRGRHRA